MTARETIMEGNEGMEFRDIIDNLYDDVILILMKSYAKEKCQELLEIVAKKVRIIEDNDEQYEEYYLDLGGSLKVDKDSILNAVDLETFIY